GNEAMRASPRRLVRAGLRGDRPGAASGPRLGEGLPRTAKSLVRDNVKVSMPSLFGGGRAPSIPDVGGSPTLSVPEGPSGGSASLLLWAFVLAAGGLLAWKALSLSRRGADAAGTGSRLGPWPRAPEPVAAPCG